MLYSLAQYSRMADSARVLRADTRSKWQHSEGGLEHAQPGAGALRLYEIEERSGFGHSRHKR
jgi:hypothetical protein